MLKKLWRRIVERQKRINAELDQIEVELAQEEAHLPSDSLFYEIVPPEPHSTGPDFQEAWNYMPGWLKIVLFLFLIVGGILAAFFIKGN